MGSPFLPVLMKPFLLAMVFVLASLSGCIGEEDASTTDIEAIFDFSPSTNIRIGDTIEFDGSASLPTGVSLTYKWDFDNDGSYDETGRETTWSYAEAKKYEVKLTVSDGTTSSHQVRTLTVASADAKSPEPDAGSYSPMTNCEGGSASSGNFYLYYICEMDKSLSSKSIMATVNVELDGSLSESGDNNDYISSWDWDLDLQRDSDGDGDSKNDADLSGEKVEWRDLAPGEYKIALTVTNGAGLSETDETVVYVNYAGKWKDFSIAGNNSNNAVEIEFDYMVVNNLDNGNTIRKGIAELVYPKQDGDCTDIPGTNNCRAILNLYSYNSSGDEAKNTSSLGPDQRSAGDCDSDNDCIIQTLTGTYEYSESFWQDGEWKFVIQNDKINDLDIESLTIKIEYK